MLNLGGEIGQIPDADKIKKLIAQKKLDLERIKKNIVKRQERAKKQMEKLEGYRNLDEEAAEKDGNQPKRGSESSDDEVESQEKKWAKMSDLEKENFL